jgi:hypothetical protein
MGKQGFDPLGQGADAGSAITAALTPKAVLGLLFCKTEGRVSAPGGMGWQNSGGCNPRSEVEASIGRCKRMIGGALHAPADESEATRTATDAAALTRMLVFRRRKQVRIP